jgi:hypothetical protein
LPNRYGKKDAFRQKVTEEDSVLFFEEEVGNDAEGQNKNNGHSQAVGNGL